MLGVHTAFLNLAGTFLNHFDSSASILGESSGVGKYLLDAGLLFTNRVTCGFITGAVTTISHVEFLKR